MLPCEHNLCQICAQYIYDNKALKIKNSRNGGARFKCPACRREVVLDMHGVHGLTRNLIVEQFIEEFQRPRPKTPKKSKPAKTVKKYIAPFCSIHRGQKKNIYCQSCGELTCSLCKCFGVHSECRVVHVVEANAVDTVNIKLKFSIKYNFV